MKNFTIEIRDANITQIPVYNLTAITASLPIIKNATFDALNSFKETTQKPVLLHRQAILFPKLTSKTEDTNTPPSYPHKMQLQRNDPGTGISDSMFYIFGILGAIVSLFGIVCNVLNLLVFLRRKSTRKTCGTLFMALSVFDLLYLVSFFLFGALEVIMVRLALRDTSFAEEMEDYMDGISNTMVTCSIYTTAVLAVDRCIAVTKPLRWALMCNKKHTFMALATLTATAVVVNLPLFVENMDRPSSHRSAQTSKNLTFLDHTTEVPPTEFSLLNGNDNIGDTTAPSFSGVKATGPTKGVKLFSPMPLPLPKHTPPSLTLPDTVPKTLKKLTTKEGTTTDPNRDLDTSSTWPFQETRSGDSSDVFPDTVSMTTELFKSSDLNLSLTETKSENSTTMGLELNSSLSKTLSGSNTSMEDPTLNVTGTSTSSLTPAEGTTSSPIKPTLPTLSEFTSASSTDTAGGYHYRYADSYFHSTVYLKVILPIFQLFGPGIVIVVSTFCTVFKVRKRGKVGVGPVGINGVPKSAVDKSANRITIQVITMATLTLISNGMIAFSFVMMAIHDTVYINKCTPSCTIFVSFAHVFVAVNSSVNLLLHAYFSKPFRDEIRQVVLFKCFCSKQTFVSSITSKDTV